MARSGANVDQQLRLYAMHYYILAIICITKCDNAGIKKLVGQELDISVHASSYVQVVGLRWLLDCFSFKTRVPRAGLTLCCCATVLNK